MSANSSHQVIANVPSCRRGTIPLELVTMTSDDMTRTLSRAFDLFALADPATFLAKATRESFDELIVRLRAEERQDPDFDRYPRLKLHDDASYFMVLL